MTKKIVTDISEYSFTTQVNMRWSDFDSFQHINNAKYLTYFEEGRIDYLAKVCEWDWDAIGMVLAHIGVDYKIPIEVNAKPIMMIRCSKIGNKSFDLDYIIVEQDDFQKQYGAATSTLVVMNYSTGKSDYFPVAIKKKICNFEKVDTILL